MCLAFKARKLHKKWEKENGKNTYDVDSSSIHPPSASLFSPPFVSELCFYLRTPFSPPLQAWIGCEPPVILAQLTSLFSSFHSLNLHLLFLTSVLFFFFSLHFFSCCYWFLRCFLFFLSVFLVSLAALVRGLLSLYSVVAIIPLSLLVSRKTTKQKQRQTHTQKKNYTF